MSRKESLKLYPIPLRIIVMKNPMAYAGIVAAKNMSADDFVSQNFQVSMPENTTHRKTKGEGHTDG